MIDLHAAHPATAQFTFPMPAERIAHIDPSDVRRGDVLVNQHGHLVGFVSSAQHDSYGSILIGKPSGAWSLSTSPLRYELFVALTEQEAVPLVRCASWSCGSLVPEDEALPLAAGDYACSEGCRYSMRESLD